WEYGSDPASGAQDRRGGRQWPWQGRHRSAWPQRINRTVRTASPAPIPWRRTQLQSRRPSCNLSRDGVLPRYFVAGATGNDHGGPVYVNRIYIREVAMADFDAQIRKSQAEVAEAQGKISQITSRIESARAKIAAGEAA